MDLGDAAAVSLSLQWVFTHADVPQRLRHQRVQSRVLEDKTQRDEKIKEKQLKTGSVTFHTVKLTSVTKL